MEIKFNPVCGKKSEILYSKPCIICLHNKYLYAKSEFGYSHAHEDEMLPSKDVTVDDASYYMRRKISCVEYGYSTEGEVWFFQLWHDGYNVFWNVESKEKAVEIVELIRDWLIENY